MKVCAVALLLALSPVVGASAQIPEPDLEGAASDRTRFLQLVEDCSAISEAFDRAWKRAVLGTVPIEVVRDDDRVGLFGAFASASHVHLVDLAHVEKMPAVTVDPSGTVVRAANHPAWAASLCTVIAHEIAEAHYAHEKNAGFEASHAYALGVENAVRQDLGAEVCRSRATWRRDEQRDVPHDDHEDVFVRTGSHVERYHLRPAPEHFSVTYESGSTTERCDRVDLTVALGWEPPGGIADPREDREDCPRN